MSSGLPPLRFVTAALFAFTLFAGSIGAQAQPQIRPPQTPPPQQGPAGPDGPQGPSQGGATVQGTTPEITMAALQAAGYQNARIYTSDNGNKRHAAGDMHGWTVSAIHANCNDSGTCLTLLYLVNFGAQATIDAAYINAWSARSYYSSMYQNDGKIFLQWGVFVGDSSVKNIQRTAQVFAASLKDVLEFKPN